ncbi:MAG: glycoside hydrolase/phage tail family protein [Hyphomonadaceae bacterium]|nr:glycoside hydrolase/phage tail family protein [Hyphomonadaceae bacterium]
MADLVFTRAGGVVGARLAPAGWQSWGRFIGRAAGGFVGERIDDALFARTRRSEGPRMASLHLQTSQEGASLPLVYGRVRIAGQVIWAARLKERREVVRSGGGKSNGGAARAEWRYSLSFAVGLCAGEIARIERAWANGQPFDLSAVAHRVHRGGEDQGVDPLIEAIEGADGAPAYRGLAYIVFEDLPLDAFGNAPPQLSFEVVRGPLDDAPRLETMARGVCLIPGSGEFAYATEPVRRVIAAGQEHTENAHADPDRANIDVSLDQLAQDMPGVETVSLVSAWFGNDLRCGHCSIRPGVEIAAKETRPLVWRAGGVTRGGAHVVSTVDGAPAFGGSPCDDSVVQAIVTLKERGMRVGLNPFVLMDIPPENPLGQPAFPWRGRISCDPLEADKTAEAATQVAAFFGAATAADFSVSGGAIACTASDWGYRRFILHHAKIAVLAGGVDFFLIGSELPGLTKLRDHTGAFPAVTALRALAADVRAILGPATKITYAADWSEYGGHQPQDGTGDVFFHLDALWADDNIDAIGIDWYPPLTDWRDGDAHADRALASRIHDPAYLRSRIEGGEGYDWFYATEEDRVSEVRTPITDGAYGKPWIYRAKDVRRFWSEAHFDRPGGVEAATPTAWVAQSKPVWLLELGAPAVDKGANAPNRFIDARSSESAAPPFSDRARDDFVQRRALEAYLAYWGDDARNPASALYDGRMIDLDHMCLWAWDARPYPHFPAREDVWSDAASWRLGHWLNGRAGAGQLAETVADICTRAGHDDVDVSGLAGVVSGLVIDAPATARDALAPLMAAHRFAARESDGRTVFAHLDDGPVSALAPDEIVDDDPRRWLARASADDTPVEARVRFLDAGADHAVAMASARRRDAAGVGVVTIDAPLVLDDAQAQALAEAALADARAGAEAATVRAPPSRLDLEPGDRLDLTALGAGEGAYRIVRIEEREMRTLHLVRDADGARGALAAAAPGAPAPRPAASRPHVLFLDLPPLLGREDDARPMAAVSATPWIGPAEIFVGVDTPSATVRGVALAPATMGTLTQALQAGPTGRWDRAATLVAHLPGAGLASVSDKALRAGANVFAVRDETGAWEILQARDITLVGPDLYEMRMLLRGLQGTEHAGDIAAGAAIVRIDDAITRLDLAPHERGADLRIVVPPSQRSPADPDAAHLDAAYDDIWARPFAPAHVRGRRDPSGDATIRWTRRARLDGDAWQGEPPLGEAAEDWRVVIGDGAGGVARTLTAGTTAVVYPAAAQIADFGGLPAEIAVTVRQISARFGPGRGRDSLLRL